MRVYSRDNVLKRKNFLLDEVKNGAVFIYPTDTVYGIGCLATNDKAIKRIRQLKNRDAKPFSIIAPNFDWIKNNCIISNMEKKWLVNLPGPYTLIMKLKNKSALLPSANAGLNSVGVRIPNHWISEFVESLGSPIITTSVNKKGDLPASSLKDLQRFDVDFIIFEGEKDSKPSKVVDLTKEEKIVRN